MMVKGRRIVVLFVILIGGRWLVRVISFGWGRRVRLLMLGLMCLLNILWLLRSRLIVGVSSMLFGRVGGGRIRVWGMRFICSLRVRIMRFLTCRFLWL